MIKEDFDKWGSLSPQIESVYIIQAEIHFPGFGEGKHMGLKERIMNALTQGKAIPSQDMGMQLWNPSSAQRRNQALIVELGKVK